MFELAWPASLLLLPLPWLLRWVLPPAKRPEAALQIAFLARLQRLNAAQLSAAGTHRRSAPRGRLARNCSAPPCRPRAAAAT